MVIKVLNYSRYQDKQAPKSTQKSKHSRNTVDTISNKRTNKQKEYNENKFRSSSSPNKNKNWEKFLTYYKLHLESNFPLVEYEFLKKDVIAFHKASKTTSITKIQELVPFYLTSNKAKRGVPTITAMFSVHTLKAFKDNLNLLKQTN